ncbi:MAG: hypothetical protein B0D92_04905 [Spirochaeta sp. LUC14_002_19_P3]|nr:MAG: hypothetical protein B0D92_04905 [Spirochaeta sp. LUC14_002_19_P3]
MNNAGYVLRIVLIQVSIKQKSDIFHEENKFCPHKPHTVRVLYWQEISRGSGDYLHYLLTFLLTGLHVVCPGFFFIPFGKADNMDRCHV